MARMITRASRLLLRGSLALLLALPSGVGAEEVPLPLIHGLVYQAGMDPAPYWVSEKLDGVRAVWDGRQLKFRSGRLIQAPAWFTRGFPDQAMDGELWLGRGRFEALSGIVRKDSPQDAAWSQVRYLLFDLPGAPGTFSQRLAAMEQLVAQAGLPHLGLVPQFRVGSEAELRKKLQEVVDGGGEGLMLHRADAPYVAGRNGDVLKLKPWDDAEAEVVAHLPGQGRNAGRLGALLVRLPDGRTLAIGSGFSDAQRDAPPPVGSIITYRYRGLNGSGLPRFATFLRVRDPL
jgi:DNA ligase 1